MDVSYPPIRRTGLSEVRAMDLQAEMVRREVDNPDHPGASVFLSIDVEGELDIGCLRRRLAEIVRGRDALNARFRRDGDAIIYDVNPLESDDVLIEEHCGEQTMPFWRNAVEQRFDVLGGPLYRFTLARRRDRTCLHIHCHHAVSDGWSMAIMFKELADRYFGSAEGPPLAPSRRAFTDYIDWYHRAKQSRYWQACLDYWRGIVASPAARAHPGYDLNVLKRRRLSLIKHMRREIPRAPGFEPVLTAHEMTPFSFFLAATFLAGLSDNLSSGGVCTALKNRLSGAFEETYGFFANTLPLYLDTDDHLDFAGLAASIRGTLSGYRRFGMLSSFDIFTALRQSSDFKAVQQPQVFLNYLPFVDASRSNDRCRLSIALDELPPLIPMWCNVGCIAFQMPNRWVVDISHFDEPAGRTNAERFLKRLSAIVARAQADPRVALKDLLAEIGGL